MRVLTRDLVRHYTENVSVDLTSVLAQRSDLLRFVRARVDSDATAEEILQSALLRGVEAEVRDDESSVAWMFRTLRNAIVDHYRRRGTAGRALEVMAADASEVSPEPAADDRARACQCVRALAKSLKPEYAEILERVDIEEQPLAEVAAEAGITPNNATVRLHRARKALRDAVMTTCKSCAKHGCADCSCRV